MTTKVCMIFLTTMLATSCGNNSKTASDSSLMSSRTPVFVKQISVTPGKQTTAGFELDSRKIIGVDVLQFNPKNDGCTLNEIQMKGPESSQWLSLTYLGGDRFGSATAGKRLYVTHLRFVLTSPDYRTCTLSASPQVSDQNRTAGLANAIGLLNAEGIPAAGSREFELHCDTHNVGTCSVLDRRSRAEFELRGARAIEVIAALRTGGASALVGADSLLINGILQVVVSPSSGNKDYFWFDRH